MKGKWDRALLALLLTSGRCRSGTPVTYLVRTAGKPITLLDCLKGADESMKINMLKAGITLSESGDALFPRAALNLSEDSSSEVRQTVRRFSRMLATVASPGQLLLIRQGGSGIVADVAQYLLALDGAADLEVSLRVFDLFTPEPFCP